MPPKPKSIPVVTPCACGECWFYETLLMNEGECFGFPPQLTLDGNAEPVFHRARVNKNDKGCHVWKERHKA